MKAFMQIPGDVDVDVELRRERSLSDKSAEGIEDMIAYVERWRSGRSNMNGNLGVIQRRCDAMRLDSRCDAMRCDDLIGRSDRPDHIRCDV